ncbi:MAG: 1-phosphofructokinase [Anaerovoracaceae bacterium]|jgi:1-phosphofructokinase
MIYTLTFNPAIDYVMHVDGVKKGTVNRASEEAYYFGGKGINVSVVLNTLGIESVALGFIAGFTGRVLQSGLSEMKVATDFVELPAGFTRINVKLKSDAETEINGRGPEIDSDSLDQMKTRLDKLDSNDILVISGLIPDSVPADFIHIIMKEAADKGVVTIIDAAGSTMMEMLEYKPFLIKPNNRELADMLGEKMESTTEIIAGTRKLREMGARNILVSRGGNGAVLMDEDGEIHIAKAIRGKVKNSVGAGDAMVAGFLTGFMRKRDYEYALKLGIAAGTATACRAGRATAEDIKETLNF